MANTKNASARDEFDNRVRQRQKEKEQEQQAQRATASTAAVQVTKPDISFSPREVTDKLRQAAFTPVSLKKDEDEEAAVGTFRAAQKDSGVRRYIKDAVNTLSGTQGFFSGDRYYDESEASSLRGKLSDLKFKGADVLNYIHTNPGAFEQEEKFVSEILGVLDNATADADRMASYYKGRDAYAFRLDKALTAGDYDDLENAVAEFRQEADLTSDPTKAEGLRRRADEAERLHYDLTRGDRYIENQAYQFYKSGGRVGKDPEVEAARIEKEISGIRNDPLSRQGNVTAVTRYGTYSAPGGLTKKAEEKIKLLESEKQTWLNAKYMQGEAVEVEQLANRVMLSEDFERNSEAGKSIYTKGTFVPNAKSNVLAIAWGNPVEGIIEKGREGYIREGLSAFYSDYGDIPISTAVIPSKAINGLTDDEIGQMTDAERDVYAALFYEDVKTGASDGFSFGKGSASDTYLEGLMPTLRKRLADTQRDEIYEFAKEHKVLGALANVGSAIAGVPGVVGEVFDQGWERMINNEWDRPLDTNAPGFYMNRVNEMTAAGITDEMSAVGAFFTQAGLSAFHNIVNVVAFGKLAPAVMALQSGTEGMYSSSKARATMGQALGMGFANAVAEYVGESVDLKFLDKSKLRIAKALESDKDFGSYVKHSLLQTAISMPGEAVSEGVTEVSNIVAEMAILGDMSRIAQYSEEYLKAHGNTEQNRAYIHAALMATKDVLLASAAGAISSAGMNIANAVGGSGKYLKGGAATEKGVPGNGLSKAQVARLEELNALYDNKTIDIQGQVERKQLLEKAGVEHGETFEGVPGDKLQGDSLDDSSIILEKDEEKYPYDQQEVIEGYEDAVDENVVKFIDYIHTLKDDKFKKTRKISIGKANQRLQKKIKALLKTDISGYDNVLTGNALMHIEKDHGKMGTTDRSMAMSEDLARIGFVINNFDSIEVLENTVDVVYQNKDQSPSPMVKISKKINGTYYVVESVPDSKSKSLYIKSAYIKNDNSSDNSKQLKMSTDPQLTSETRARSFAASAISDTAEQSNDNAVANSSIPQATQKVNSDFFRGKLSKSEMARLEELNALYDSKTIDIPEQVERNQLLDKAGVEADEYEAFKRRKEIEENYAATLDGETSSVTLAELLGDEGEAIAEKIADNIGVAVGVVREIASNTYAVGSYNGGQISIAEDAGERQRDSFPEIAAQQLAEAVVYHEFTHVLKEASPKAYAMLEAEAVRQAKKEKPNAIEDKRAELIENSGETPTDALVREEITARAIERMVRDGTLPIEKIKARLDSKEKNRFQLLLQRMAERIRTLFDKLGIKRRSDIEVLRDRWLGAVDEARSNRGQPPKRGSRTYAFIKTENGVRRYASDFPSEMSDNEKIATFKERIATVFNLGQVSINTDTKKIHIRGDKFTAQKNAFPGNDDARETYMSRINALYDYADILSTATFEGKSIEDSYKNPSLKPKNQAHKGVKYWYYFKNKISIDGIGYDVILNIRDKGGEQYQYFIDLKRNEAYDDSNTALYAPNTYGAPPASVPKKGPHHTPKDSVHDFPEKSNDQTVNNSENSADDIENSMEPFFDDEGSPDKKGNEAEAIIGGKQSNDFAEALTDMQKRSVNRAQRAFISYVRKAFEIPDTTSMKTPGELCAKMAVEYLDSGKISDKSVEELVAALGKKKALKGLSTAEIRRRLGKAFEIFRDGLDEAKKNIDFVKSINDGVFALPQSEAEFDALSYEQKVDIWRLKERLENSHEAAMAQKGKLPENVEKGIDRVLLGFNTLDSLFEGYGDYALIKHICEVESAYKKVAAAVSNIKAYKRKELENVADVLLDGFENWGDKEAGVLYSRETMERNIRDIVPDKERADEIIAEYFEPVHKHEADAVRMRNAYRDRVRDLEISRKVEKGNAVSESFAVQWYGELMDSIRKLEQNSHLSATQLEALSDMRKAAAEFFTNNPGLDKESIEKHVDEFQQIYAELLDEMNRVRVEYGYAPIHARSGYFPHFLKGQQESIISLIADALETDRRKPTPDGDPEISIYPEKAKGVLPTEINGLTENFKPGKKWFAHEIERKGNKTDYDAVLGFDNYIQTCSDIIHHTGDVQKLRALARCIRYKSGDKGIKKEVERIMEDEALSEEMKDEAIKAAFSKDKKYALSNFVVELDEYTNILAGKKSALDRTVEKMVGRRIYRIVKSVEGRVGANMVAVNPGSWLTNFIPISQAWASIDTKHIVGAMVQTLRSYIKGDVISDASSFLVKRRGDDPLVKTRAAQISEVASKPMEWIDNFTSDVLVRARYNVLVERKRKEEKKLLRKPYEMREASFGKYIFIKHDILKDKPAEQKTIDYIEDFLRNFIGANSDLLSHLPTDKREVYAHGRLPREYTNSKYTQRIRSRKPEVFNDKMQASAALPGLIEASGEARVEDARHTQNKDVAKVYKYESRFAVPVYASTDKKTAGVNAYTCDLVITENSKGRLELYDVINIKADTPAAEELLKEVDRTTSSRGELPVGNGSQLKGINNDTVTAGAFPSANRETGGDVLFSGQGSVSSDTIIGDTDEQNAQTAVNKQKTFDNGKFEQEHIPLISDIDAQLLAKADAYAAAVMADRSKGSMPTLFESRNPIIKMFSMFQLEQNNQLSYVFKDLPREAAEEAGKRLALMLVKFCLGAWIYNEVYEYIFGRRPALDPIDMLNDLSGDITGYKIPNTVDLTEKLICDGHISVDEFKVERAAIAGAAVNFVGNVSEQLPFISGLVGGGRIPLQSALPNLASLKKAATFNGKPWQSHVYDLYKGISPVAYYTLVPFGGGALKKLIEGTEFNINRGSVVYNSKGEKELQYTISDESVGSFLAEAAKAVTFGKTTTVGGADWAERGFKNLSVKDTVLWGQLIEECGLGRKEAYDTVIESQIGKSEDKSATENKRAWLKDIDLSDEAKYYIFRSRIATDKASELMDALLDDGFDEAEVFRMIFGMEGMTENAEEAEYIFGSDIDDEGKFELWYDRIASDRMKDQVDAFIAGGMSKDEAYRYMSGLWRAQADAPSGEGKDSMFEALDGMDMKPEDKYEAYYWNIATQTEREMMDMLTDGGLGKSEAYDLTSGFRRTDSLKTSEEKQAEKSRLLADSDISDGEKLEIYSNHITSSKKKVSAAEAVLESGGDFNAFLESFGGKTDVPAVEFLSTVTKTNSSEIEKLKILEGFLDDEDVDAYSRASEAGIGVEEYARYSEALTKITSKDASGKSVNGLKKQRVLTYIDDMDITNAQKDYLYRELGYSESRIYEAPWRGGRRYEGEIFEGYSEAQQVPSRTPAHSPAEREARRQSFISDRRDAAWREYHNKVKEEDGRNPVIEDAIWGGEEDDTGDWYDVLPKVKANDSGNWYDELPKVKADDTGDWYDVLPKVKANDSGNWYDVLPKVGAN